MEVPSERFPTPDQPYSARDRIRRRGTFQWEAAWKRAFIAAAVCLGLAIVNDWWGIRFGAD
jgi:hypothetical protein